MADQDEVWDFSFAHATVTRELVAAAEAGRHPCIGGIAYAGAHDTAKNITKTELRDLLAAGYAMGLVIEDIATDAIGGFEIGREQGRRLVDAAAAMDYDVANCVLFGGYDTDAHPGDYRHLAAYMGGFHVAVPHAGYYGDSDSIDFMFNRGRRYVNWQAAASSWSPKDPTPNAHLWQQVGGMPKAFAGDVDVNFVRIQPLQLMGEQEMPTAKDIVDELMGRHIWGDADKPTYVQTIRQIATGVRQLDPDKLADLLAADIVAALPTTDLGMTKTQLRKLVREASGTAVRGIFADASTPDASAPAAS